MAKPHHAGHRERLRERARGGGLTHLPDYELLELFLFRSQPQGDVKPVAKALLARFGSLSAVLAASVEDLMTVRAEDSKGRMKGVGAETALDLTALHEVSRRVVREPAARRPVISSWTALVSYVRVALQHEPREQFRVLYLDKKNQLQHDEILNRGTVDHAPVYPREVVRRALEVSASAIILVHNHPSGDPTPSRADIQMTKQIVEAARSLGVEVHDHLIVGREGVSSFRQLGLM
ncbi:DNA repair protein RadC [Brevundimonas sp. BAL450]|nr:DNA repair protein RadC [Brevundimonas sp. BAL450]